MSFLLLMLFAVQVLEAEEPDKEFKFGKLFYEQVNAPPKEQGWFKSSPLKTLIRGSELLWNGITTDYSLATPTAGRSPFARTDHVQR